MLNMFHVCSTAAVLIDAALRFIPLHMQFNYTHIPDLPVANRSLNA